MAFKSIDFNVIAYANGFTLWHYSSKEDSLETIEQDNYFQQVKMIANTGDIIIITSNGNTKIRQLKLTENKISVVALQ